MNDALVDYLNTQIKQAPARLLPYTKEGPRWTYPKRYAFYRIKKYASAFLQGKRDQRWLILPGLRGVGKTTLMAQSYFEIAPHVPLARRIYVSMDDAVATIGASLREVLEAYEAILGEKLEDVKQPTFLFIDEIQQDKNWALVLKALYDRARNVFFVCTGSSAVSLQTNPDIARRAIIEKLYPLSFGEFEMIKNNIFPKLNLKQEIKTALYESRNAEEAYNNLKLIEPRILPFWKSIKAQEDVESFLKTGTLPFAIKTLNEAQAYDSISLVLDRMITKDFSDLGRFNTETLNKVKRLLFIMAESDTLNINNVGRDLGMTNVTLTAVLEALEKAEIIIRVPAHGSNAAVARKPSKYLFMSPAIRMSLISVAGIPGAFSNKKGKLLEDIVGLHFYREFIASGVGTLRHDSSQHGADFIFQIADKRRLIIEVGAGSKDLSQVKNSMERIRSNFGLVLCSDHFVLHKEDNIVKVPLAYFLLM